jgi:hypothetical protein
MRKKAPGQPSIMSIRKILFITLPVLAGIHQVAADGIIGSYTVVNVEGCGGEDTNTAAMARCGYITGPYPVSSVRTWWDNYYYDGCGGDVAFVPNNSTFTNEVSLEYPAGTFYRLTFNGQTNITMQPGQIATPSDPLAGVIIPANTPFWIRCYRTCTNGAQWAYGFITDNNGPYHGDWLPEMHGGYSEGAGTTDQTMTGTLPDNYTRAFGPTAITGARADGCKAAPVSLIIAGDSIFYGVNGGYAIDQQVTIATAGLSKTVAFANFSAPGLQLTNEYLNAVESNLWPQIGNVILHETKVNDLNAGGYSFAYCTNLLILEWNYWLGSGLKVFETTCTPVSTSTDGFETLSNQTTASCNAVRVQLNDWLRTNSFPGVTVIDLASMVESSLDSGLWNVNGTSNFMTTDGLHPNASGSEYVMTNGLWLAALQQIFQLQNSVQTSGGGPTLTITYSGSQATVSWSPSLAGWTLQTNNDLINGTWSNYAGAVSNNSMTTLPCAGNLFFRLWQQ